MRLGQIKRNYKIEPSKVVSFLESKKITISNHPNSKVTEEQLQWILDEFKPEPEEVVVKEKAPIEIKKEIIEKQEPVIKKKVTPRKEEEPTVGEVIELPKKPVKKIEEDTGEDIEVIRAPKVEIGGIKVLGKIDLPKPKVVEVEAKIEENTKEEEEEEEPKDIDPLAHIHPSKRAKVKAEEVIKKIPKSKKIRVKSESENKKVTPKKAKEIKAEKNSPKGKKKKQIEKEAKLASAKKARKEQEYVKKHGAPKKKKTTSPQRIEIRSDGTIIPKHEIQKQEKTVKYGIFARFWKWFNS